MEALLLESGCCVGLPESKVLMRHGDAAIGSLEWRSGREGCCRVVAVRVRPLIDASLNAIVLRGWVVLPP